MDRIHIEKEIEEIRTPELFLAYHPNSHVFSRHYYVTKKNYSNVHVNCIFIQVKLFV